MRNSLGFLVDNLGPNQIAFSLTQSINVRLREKFDWDFTFFIENPCRPCVVPNFAVMDTTQAFTFDGTIVATNLSLANFLITSCPCAAKKIFYIQDLEWLRMQQKLYGDLAAIYRNPSLNLVVRSNQQKKVVEDCWNIKDVPVVDLFNLDKFLEVVDVANYNKRMVNPPVSIGR